MVEASTVAVESDTERPCWATLAIAPAATRGDAIAVLTIAALAPPTSDTPPPLSNTEETTCTSPPTLRIAAMSRRVSYRTERSMTTSLPGDAVMTASTRAF